MSGAKKEEMRVLDCGANTNSKKGGHMLIHDLLFYLRTLYLLLPNYLSELQKTYSFRKNDGGQLAMSI